MKNETAGAISLTLALGVGALAAGAAVYNIGAKKEMDEIRNEAIYTSPAMKNARELAQTRKKLESCVLPEGVYNTPATAWDQKTQDCLHDAKWYEIMDGDVSKLKNADAIKQLLKSQNDYWVVFGQADPFIDPFKANTGVAPYTTQRHMDAALEIMKRRDWLTNSDLTTRVFELLEESYDEYAKCGRDTIYGEPRDERCRNDAAQVRKNYIRLNRETATAAKSTRVPMDMLNRLESK